MPLLSGWINRLTEHAKEEIGETIRGLVLYVLAGVGALAALVFVTLAIFWALEREFSPISAALIMAGGYAVIAGILVLWATSDKAARLQHNETQATGLHAAGHADSTPIQAAMGDTSKMMGVDLEDIAKTLSVAGYRAESLAVMAASSVAQQLSPLQFLSLIFVGSFLFGRRLRR